MLLATLPTLLLGVAADNKQSMQLTAMVSNAILFRGITDCPKAAWEQDCIAQPLL